MYLYVLSSTIPAKVFNMPQKNEWKPFPQPPNLTDKNIFFGTSGYYFDDWLGRFNPPTGHSDPDSRDRLKFYLKYFPLVEINQTFYREIEPAWFETFLQKCKNNTRIVIKVHRSISHNKYWNFKAVRPLMEHHVAIVKEAIKSKNFYSFLIQLDDRVIFSPNRLEYLKNVSKIALTGGADVHIELRNISWHQLEVLQQFQDHGIGICNTEIPPVDSSIFPLKAYATSPKGYLRYSGKNLNHWRQQFSYKLTRKEQTEARNLRYNYYYSKSELQNRLKDQIRLRQKTESVAVAFNNHYNAAAVENAITNMQLIDTHLKASIPIEGAIK